MGIKTNFMGKEYSSQKEFKKYIDNIMYNKIKFCGDIMNTYPQEYEILIELLKRHPEWESKSKDIINIETLPNDGMEKKEYNMKSIHMNIINKTGKIDIGWNCAIKGKGKTYKQELTSAMRHSIEPQITEFRRNAEHKCVSCNKKNCKVHVDHYEPQFNELVNDFTHNKSVPKVFGENENYTRCFTKDDKEFEQNWVSFHKDNATLRILCEDCNLRREKSKKCKDDNDLNTYIVKDLKKLCKERNIKIPSKFKKKDIIELIKNQ